ncbi:MAG: outer membrane beta-barrel protein [Syntrophobacter sp.]
MVKRLSLVFVMLAMLFCVASPASSQTYPLGDTNVALKVEYLRFMDDSIRELNAGDGIYVGIEAYKQLLLPNLYFGMQIGWGGSSGDVNVPWFTYGEPISYSTDVNYVPIEFNVKYAIPLDRCLILDFGSGFSINYFDITVKDNLWRNSGSENDWIFGGQFFVDLNYKYANWLFGVGVKYQLTDTMSFGGTDTGISADNLRIGLQAGFTF